MINILLVHVLLIAEAEMRMLLLMSIQLTEEKKTNLEIKQN